MESERNESNVRLIAQMVGVREALALKMAFTMIEGAGVS
jgi:hypothetical protein